MILSINRNITHVGAGNGDFINVLNIKLVGGGFVIAPFGDLQTVIMTVFGYSWRIWGYELLDLRIRRRDFGHGQIVSWNAGEGWDNKSKYCQ